MSGERELSPGEVHALRREGVFLSEGETTADEFPSLNNMSAGFLFSGVVRPQEPASPEYVGKTCSDGVAPHQRLISASVPLWFRSSGRRSNRRHQSTQLTSGKAVNRYPSVCRSWSGCAASRARDDESGRENGNGDGDAGGCARVGRAGRCRRTVAVADL